MINTLGIRYMS